jgi:tetratricopeptide (TPR) repeat protein
MSPSPITETKKQPDTIPQPRAWVPSVLAACALLAVSAAYANHFHNSFHFDDFHTITGNPAIRSLTNVPQIFRDARTFSVLPSHQSYRPLVSASLALDYWLGGGLNPLWFHISTFAWYLLLLALLYLLFARIFNFSQPGPNTGYLALFAVAWYGLHPVNAETVNYVIQRADLYSTLGMIAGLVVYCYWQTGRKFGLYLVPVAAGALAKPIALVFPALLFLYVILCDEHQFHEESNAITWAQLRRSARTCLPALAACAILGVFEAAMTPRTFEAGSPSHIQFWLTQPIVAFHYFKSFFLPTELSADTDRQLVSNIFSETAVIGLAFLCGLVFAIRASVRSRELRPIAFGLLWFLIALVPTSLFPLAEAENDHRMFFPFVGLGLAVTWAIALLLKHYEERRLKSPRWRTAVATCAVALLAMYAYGTHVRNAVWRSEESLWQDVVQKSPRNGRGLMNYGLTQLSKGNTLAAYDYFQRASFLTPNYSTLEVNQGVAAGALRRDLEAEDHFRRAIALAPRDSQPYFFYGRWLHERGRIPEAISNLEKSAAFNQADLDPRYLLMLVYAEQLNWANLNRLAGEVLHMAPADPAALRYLAMARVGGDRLATAAQRAGMQPTPENYLGLSLQYFRAGRYDECVHAAREALRLRPGYAEAYNNIAAGYQSMGRWDDAIAAAQEAIRLKPDLQLARNNLAYALSQRNLQAKKN